MRSLRLYYSDTRSPRRLFSTARCPLAVLSPPPSRAPTHTATEVQPEAARLRAASASIESKGLELPEDRYCSPHLNRYRLRLLHGEGVPSEVVPAAPG